MRMLRVVNWDKFQHYKDRDPPWIKLHRGVLEDYEFNRLSDISKGHLILIWLLASRCDNRIPADPSWVRGRIGAIKDPDLDLLVASGFLEQADGEEPSRSRDWGSRYIPEPIRDAVMARDGGRCRQCSSNERLEIDHVIPVSKGGSSDLENLQVLCRSCNRSKRSKLSEQVATQTSFLRTSEGEGEAEQETEGEQRQGVQAVDAFDRFWLAYPKKKAKGSAEKAWAAMRPPIAAVLNALAWQVPSFDWTKEGGRFVPHPATYIRAKGWEDEPTTAAPTRPAATQQRIDTALEWIAQKQGGK